MKILVTGAAGFIGYHLCRRLLADGHTVTGIDNLNDYYDPALKTARLALLGYRDGISTDPKFTFLRADIADTGTMTRIFSEGKFDTVVNLAAQAGVRYSIENPRAYVQSNVDGFLNILEGCRDNKVGHLVFASSSSVYGLNGNVPFSEHDSIAHPVSLYAATKKSGELMAHAYSRLYSLPVTGLRFFTVYGPWGRPDMSPYLFADAILSDRPIKVFNNGDMMRDFTYIDDIVEAMTRIICIIPKGDPDWNAAQPDPATSPAPYRIYNIGSSSPVRLMDFISEIERAAGREAQKQMLPMQPGDVTQTWADCSSLIAATGFAPATPLRKGVEETVAWFKAYKGINHF